MNDVKYETLNNASELFIRWLKERPDSEFTRIAHKNLEYGDTGGHFMTAVYNGDLDTAFAHADTKNLAILESLTGTTKTLWGKKFWGWQ